MIRAAGITGLLTLLALSASAEVSVDYPASGPPTPYFQPAARGPWTQVRQSVPTGDILNPQGDLLADSWPSVYTNAGDARPEAVWSTGGVNSEVLLAIHSSGAWVGPINVSRSDGEDVLASVATDTAANRFLVWSRARNGRNAVVLNVVNGDSLQVGSGWELSARRNEARRPVLAVFVDDLVYAAYEEQENSGNSSVSVVVDRVRFERAADRQVHCGGANTPDIARVRAFGTGITSTTFAADVRIHVEDGHLWVDWLDRPDRLGWSELVGRALSDPVYRDFSPEEGQEAARDAARRAVLGL